MRELIERGRQLYAKAKDETAPGGYIAMVELRNLVPELLDAMEQAAEFVELPRLHETRQQGDGTVR